MLKVRAISDEGADRRLFAIVLDGDTAPAETLSSIARVANRLVRENELPGEYRPAEPGTLELRLAAISRSFFHDGIVFAAIDAVNDPVKSPTLNRLDLDIS
jgi:hypothetical protein